MNKITDYGNKHMRLINLLIPIALLIMYYFMVFVIKRPIEDGMRITFFENYKSWRNGPYVNDIESIVVFYISTLYLLLPLFLVGLSLLNSKIIMNKYVIIIDLLFSCLGILSSFFFIPYGIRIDEITHHVTLAILSIVIIFSHVFIIVNIGLEKTLSKLITILSFLSFTTIFLILSYLIIS